ncbi:MAG TPA: malectin domain-containing carbohydrate-binding protein, partial [bacterium]|nr:malectin domain-containing carbohydrate-binding protein [bacterium]
IVVQLGPASVDNAKLSAIQIIPQSSSVSAFRVHCGGSQYVDSQGQTWSADTAFNGGFTYQTANAISGTSDPALYDDERAGNPYTYSFAVPPGSYQVTLKFAEVFWNSPGQRVFNVSINGAQVLTNFDIAADAGGANQADDKQFNNITPDGNGRIVVQLGPASVDNAKLSAIEITPQSNTTSVSKLRPRLSSEAPSGPVTNYVHRLHALDLLTGAEKFGGPVTIAAVWNGTGGPITFNSQWQVNRPGLVLSGGLLYTFWASHCDDGQYYGWVLGYNPADLSLQSVFNTAPVTQRGGIWQAGAPPAIDADGSFFMSTATGAFDAAFGGIDYGESDIHFTGGANPAIIDYFSPYNEAQLDATDNEMGSVGMMLLPDEAGSPNHPHLVTAGDKAGDVFLLDRDNMGGYRNGPGGKDAVVQEFHPAPTNNFAIFTTPCYYNGNVYWSCVGGPIQSFQISNAQYNTTPTSVTPESYIYPGCVPSVSSNGPGSAGILWAIQPGNPAVLRAYDANDLSIELYDTSFNAGRDGLGTPNTKFTPPTIINGKVYVATTGSLAVFGLLPPASKARPLAAKGTVTTTPSLSPSVTPTLTPTPTPNPPFSRTKGPVVAAPNVVRAGEGTVVFQAPEDGAGLEVSIYDLDGEKVAEVEGAPGLSRLTWDSRGVASGLYLARVKVTDADGSTRQQTLKVMVVH